MKKTCTLIINIILLFLSFVVNAKVDTVQMTDDLTFEPSSVTIQKGDTIVWKNISGSFNHNSVSGEGCSESSKNGIWESPDLSSGETFMRKFDSAGTFNYFCSIATHCSQDMKGVINVSAHDTTMHLMAKLSGSAEVPQVETMGFGMVDITYKAMSFADDTLMLSGSFDSLSSKIKTSLAGGAHIHDAYAGANGHVKQPLNITYDSDTMGGTFEKNKNTFAISSELSKALKNRKLYINIHSMNYPAGEIRGQIIPDADSVYMVILSGASEVMPVNTQAHGGAIIEKRGDTVTLTGSFHNLSSDYQASHFHNGYAGSNGNVSVTLDATLDKGNKSGIYEADSNTYILNNTQFENFINRQMYINIHSSTYPGGELRGQILPHANAYFTATLMPDNHLDRNVVSNGYGNVKIEVNNTDVIMSGSFKDLEGNFKASHPHFAEVGNNGPILDTLTVKTNNKSGVYQADSNRFPIAGTVFDNMKKEQYYINVHSSEYPGGELRGQILAEPNHFPGKSGIVKPEEGDSVDVVQGSGDNVTVKWSEAMNNDNNIINYKWLLSSKNDFTDTVNMQMTRDTMFSISDMDMDSVLEEHGAQSNDTLTFYHKVTSMDGSLLQHSDTNMIVIVRGANVNANKEKQLSGTLKGITYPNPAENYTKFEYQLPSSAKVSFTLLNNKGSKIMEKYFGKQPKGVNQFKINTNKLSSGYYIYKINAVNNGEVKIIHGKLVVK